MIVNDSLFALVCEFRRWRGQYFKLLIIIFGFVISTALLAISLRLGGMLFYENPSWTNTEKPLYTIARLNKDNSLSAINRQTLVQLKNLPLVDEVSWIVTRSFDFSFEGRLLNKLNTVIYSNNAIENLGLQIPKNDVFGVWITHSYWLNNLGAQQNIVGRYLNYKNLPQGLPILGILDQRYDHIGTEDVDIWIPEEILVSTTPFSPGIMSDKFLLAVPFYYGVFSASTKFSPAQASSQLASLDLSVSGMSFGNASLPLTILPGVNLDPKARDNMISMWHLLNILILALWLILTFSYFSLASSRAIVIAEELRTLRLLGASTRQLLLPMIYFSLLIAGVVIALLLPCLQFVVQLVQSSEGYQQVFHNQAFLIRWPILLSAVTIVIASIMLCALVPVSNLLSSHLFTRAVSRSLSVGQVYVSKLILIVQLSAALCAFYGLIHMVTVHWSQQSADKLNLSLIQSNFDSGQFSFAWQQILAESDMHNLPIALTTSPFENLARYELLNPISGQTENIAIVHASNNYFVLLQTPVMGLSDKWQTGVVINQALADRLSGSNSRESLIGTNLKYGLYDQTLTISGIVRNMPHWGEAQSVRPTLYLPITHLNEETLTNFSILSTEQRALEKITQWIGQQSHAVQVTSPISLQSILASVDSQSNDLLWFTFFVSLIIVVGVLSGIWYQSQAQLKANKQTIGVLLALGASDRFLLLSRYKQIFIALTLAAILCSLLIVSMFFGELLTFKLNFVAILGALVISLITSCIAVSVPMFTLLRNPIQQSLRDL